MSFTRFHDDPCRIKKALQESTDQGRYMLDVPGNGTNPCYMADPYMRMQKWGANLQTNVIGVENDLRNMTRKLNRDFIQENNYVNHIEESKPIQYPTCNPFTDQSRVTHPAWEVRDLEQVNWAILPLNPQENVCIPFQNNLNTRILEKDYFIAQPPCLQMDNSVGSIGTGPYSGHGNPPNTLCTRDLTCRKI
jgi:hypothetical protein